MPAFIEVSPDAHDFIDPTTNQPFVPLGCNYFDPQCGWPFHVWSRFDKARVADQLAMIASAGLNSIRVFLDTGKLNPAPDQYSPEGFDLVDQLVSLASDNNLRIIFSGPNWIEGMPEHRRGDVYGAPRQLDMLCDLWQKIVERWGQNPTVMTWELYNEPHLHWQRKARHITPQRFNQWLRFVRRNLGIAAAADVEASADFPSIDPRENPDHPVDRQLYRAYIRFLDDLGENWVARQCQAIRAAGAKNLISVGLVQWSTPILLPKGTGYAAVNPRRVAKHLDYMSQHFYPIVQSLKLGIDPEWDVQLAYAQIVARAAHVPGKPLVMEEFGWKGGPIIPKEPQAYPEEHQTHWCAKFMDLTRQVACGWLNWPFADCPEPNADISAASGLWTSDLSHLKHWGQEFLRRAKQLQHQTFSYVPPKHTYTLDLPDYLYDNAGAPSHALLKQIAAEGHAHSVEVLFQDA